MCLYVAISGIFHPHSTDEDICYCNQQLLTVPLNRMLRHTGQKVVIQAWSRAAIVRISKLPVNVCLVLGQVVRPYHHRLTNHHPPPLRFYSPDTMSTSMAKQLFVS